MSLKISPQLVEAKMYGDGIVRRQQSKIETYNVELELNKIPIEDRAGMLGQTCVKGVVEEGISDEAPDIAIGYEIEGDESSSEYVWLYKGKMAPLEDATQQKTDKLTYQSQTAKLTFVPREYDGKTKKYADSTGTGYEATTGSTWFNAVPAPAGA
jgi:phi13 family phage major tail protein